jgi:hypothetical protein
MDITSLKGYWDGEYYMVPGGNGYLRCAAVRRGISVEVTDFGREQLAYLSADVVLSEEPKKRPRKLKVDVVPDIELDI